MVVNSPEGAVRVGSIAWLMKETDKDIQNPEAPTG
jgi:hypothetical protein